MTREQKTAESFPELIDQFDLAKISSLLKWKLYDTDDLSTRLQSTLLKSGVERLAWEIDCDDARQFFYGIKHDDLLTWKVGKRQAVPEGAQKDEIAQYYEAFAHFRLVQLHQVFRDSHDVGQLRFRLLKLHKLCYANVFMPEIVVKLSPPDVSQVLSMYAYMFGLTDFMQRVQEEVNRVKHERSMSMLREIEKIYSQGANCNTGEEMMDFITRVKPAMAYVGKLYHGTPLGTSFNALVVSRSINAVKRKVAHLQMPLKLSQAYNRAAIGGETIGDDEALRILLEISSFMTQNKGIFHDDSPNLNSGTIH